MVSFSYTAVMKIGKKLHSIRLEKNISKNELCRLTGLNKGSMYRLENDLTNPTFSTVVKVGRALKTPIWEIVKSAEFLDNVTEYLQEGYDDIE